jgi:hypothetical protein
MLFQIVRKFWLCDLYMSPPAAWASTFVTSSPHFPWVPGQQQIQGKSTRRAAVGMGRACRPWGITAKHGTAPMIDGGQAQPIVDTSNASWLAVARRKLLLTAPLLWMLRTGTGSGLSSAGAEEGKSTVLTLNEGGSLIRKECQPCIETIRLAEGARLYRSFRPRAALRCAAPVAAALPPQQRLTKHVPCCRGGQILSSARPVHLKHERPDLLDDATYGADGAEFFRALETALARRGVAARPSNAHAGAGARRLAAAWGEPCTCWPVGDFSFAFFTDESLILPPAWLESAATSRAPAGGPVAERAGRWWSNPKELELFLDTSLVAGTSVGVCPVLPRRWIYPRR